MNKDAIMYIKDEITFADYENFGETEDFKRMAEEMFWAIFVLGEEEELVLKEYRRKFDNAFRNFTEDS